MYQECTHTSIKHHSHMMAPNLITTYIRKGTREDLGISQGTGNPIDPPGTQGEETQETQETQGKGDTRVKRVIIAEGDIVTPKIGSTKTGVGGEVKGAQVPLTVVWVEVEVEERRTKAQEEKKLEEEAEVIKKEEKVMLAMGRIVEKFVQRPCLVMGGLLQTYPWLGIT